MIPSPGLYSWAYPSAMVSPYYCWFVLMGYPQLDVAQYPDGSWDIIQYYGSPLIPCETEFQMVLGTMENMEISYSFIEKYLKQIDMQRKEFWDREEAKTKAVEDEHAATHRHAEDLAERGTRAIMKNEGLLNRIAKYGMKELDLSRIARHIPKHEYVKPWRGQNVLNTGKSVK